MSKSTRETLYPGTRLSAKVPPRDNCPDSSEPEQPNYPLIEALRAAREQGYDAITAVERYNPDFSIDLSRCHIEAEAEALLERWYARRVAVLDDTRETLRRLWREHQEVASAP